MHRRVSSAPWRLALRLAGHRLVAERTGEAPVLVLDDVLSELDDHRATALLGHLPAGQVVITTASELPSAARADHVLRVDRRARHPPSDRVRWGPWPSLFRLRGRSTRS